MIKKLQALKAKKGFTLVELIVVIAIIGVLAAILVPAMLGYVTSSQVTSANSTAASLKNNIDNFLTACDTNGYGMLRGSKTSTLTISINNGTWSVTNSTPASFKNGNGKSWTSTAQTGSTGQSKVGVGSPEKLLAIELADLFPEVKTGSIGAVVTGGKCLALYYTADSTTGDSQISAMLASSGWNNSVCSWDNTTAGVSSNGFIVGTAPELPLG